jgi:glycosyltransferase involved in cell wall biosynthesis
LQVLPDDDPRLLDAEACDLPSSDFIVREAVQVLAISRFSADELRKHLARRGVPGPSIEVIRLANELRPADSATNVPLAELRPGEFILAVGDVVIRKNHALLARVWKMKLAAGVALPKLVIVGRIDPECFDFVRDIRAEEALSNQFIFLANADDAALAWLYGNCRFTVFPSRLEGFGLPVAESLGYGKVCISSSASAVPEAGQGVAIELDPDDDHAWAEAIHGLCRDDAVLAEREADVSRRFKPVTWHDTVAEILDDIAAARRRDAAA